MCEHTSKSVLCIIQPTSRELLPESDSSCITETMRQNTAAKVIQSINALFLP